MTFESVMDAKFGEATDDFCPAPDLARGAVIAALWNTYPQVRDVVAAARALEAVVSQMPGDVMTIALADKALALFAKLEALDAASEEGGSSL